MTRCIMEQTWRKIFSMKHLLLTVITFTIIFMLVAFTCTNFLFLKKWLTIYSGNGRLNRQINSRELLNLDRFFKSAVRADVILGENSSLSKDFHMFQTELNHSDIFVFERFLRSVFQILQENNVTFMMYGGTLLGSYRHHGLIPWDDDIDLFLPISERAHLKSIFAVYPDVKHELVMFLPKEENPWKIFYSHRMNRKSRWPFLDFMFYKEDEKQIWDVVPGWEGHKYAKGDVFPLKMRPFENLMLPSPTNEELFLSKYYNKDICKSKGFSYRTLEYLKSKQVPCSYLHFIYPHIQRTKTTNGTVENFMFDGLVLNKYISKT